MREKEKFIGTTLIRMYMLNMCAIMFYRRKNDLSLRVSRLVINALTAASILRNQTGSLILMRT